MKKLKHRTKLECIKIIFKGVRAFRKFRGDKILQEYVIKIPIVVAIGENRGCSYMRSQEIKAIGSFRDYVFNADIPIENRCAIVLELAKTLANLHSKHIILCDINMDNVLVCEHLGSFEICILDNERTHKCICWVKVP